MTIHDFGFLGPIPHEHGTRASYRAGCSCLPCRSANACYEAQRAKARALGDGNGWVDPAPARAKLLELRALGIGYKRAAHLAGVAVKTVRDLRTGRSQHIRMHVSKAILAIEHPSLAKGVKVNGYRTRYLLDCLRTEGLTSAWIASRLGLRSRRLQLHHEQVTVANHLKVDALYRQITAEGPELSA